MEKIYSNVYITSMAKKYIVPRPVMRRPAQFRPSANPTGSIRPASKRARNTAPRLAARRSGSLLLRKTKQRRIRVDGTGGQVSYFNHVSEPSKWQIGLMKNSAPNYYTTNGSSRLTTVAGSQGVHVFPIFSGGTYGGTGVMSDLEMIKYHITGNNSNDDKTQRFMISKSTTKYMITNQENTNCHVDIYDIVCRNDTNYDPLECITNGLANEGGLTAYAFGVTPTSSGQFTAHYKILQKSSMLLGQGQSHTHIVKYAPNKMFKSDLLIDGDKSLRNFTVYTMIVHHGLPVNDISNNVSIGPTTLDVVSVKQMKFYRIEDSQSNYHYTTNLPVLTGNLDIMNIARGVADIVASA